MKHPKLKYIDNEERELIESIEKNFDKYVPVTDPVLLDSMRKAAENTLKKIRKTSTLNMRVNPDDVAIIKVKAHKMGIPYQTYISLVLKQVAEGKMSVTM